MSSDEESIGNQYISDEEDVAVAKKKRGKKGKDPNKPKRNQSAFFLYSNANRARIKEENPGIAFGEVAKLMSAEFKALSAEERAKYDKLAEDDKDRYLEEMKTYVAPIGDDSDDDKPTKKKKATKDPNAPKRPMSAYFLYSNAIRSSVKEQNPDAKFGDIAKIISAQYKKLTEAELAEWQKKADDDKQRYQFEMEAYRG